MKFVHPSSLYFSHPRLNANEGTSFEERRITDIIGPHASRHQSPDRHYRHSYSGFPPCLFTKLSPPYLMLAEQLGRILCGDGLLQPWTTRSACFLWWGCVCEAYWEVMSNRFRAVLPTRLRLSDRGLARRARSPGTAAPRRGALPRGAFPSSSFRRAPAPGASPPYSHSSLMFEPVHSCCGARQMFSQPCCLRRVTLFASLFHVPSRFLIPAAEYVLFVKPSELQVQLYKLFLHSRTIQSILSGENQSVALAYINALRKLCNSPALIHETCQVFLPVLLHSLIWHFFFFFSLALREKRLGRCWSRASYHSLQTSIPERTSRRFPVRARHL